MSQSWDCLSSAVERVLLSALVASSARAATWSGSAQWSAQRSDAAGTIAWPLLPWLGAAPSVLGRPHERPLHAELPSELVVV